MRRDKKAILQLREIVTGAIRLKADDIDPEKLAEQVYKAEKRANRKKEIAVSRYQQQVGAELRRRGYYAIPGVGYFKRAEIVERV
jgi:hypothetical protein